MAYPTYYPSYCPDDPEGQPSLPDWVASLEGRSDADLPRPGQITTEALRILEDLLLQLEEARKRAAGDPRALMKLHERAAKARALIETLRRAGGPTADARLINSCAPTEAQLAFRGRRVVLLEKAEGRLQKSSYVFPSPRGVQASCAALLRGQPPEDAAEAEHRILHFLCEAPMASNGPAAASFLVRLTKAGRAVLEGRVDEPGVADVRDSLNRILEMGRGV